MTLVFWTRWVSRPTRTFIVGTILFISLVLLKPRAYAQILPIAPPNAAHGFDVTAPTATGPQRPPIPLGQIADRAEELDLLLRDIKNQALDPDELATTRGTAEIQAAETDERVRQTRDLLAGSYTTIELEDEQRYWRARGDQCTAQQKPLTLQAANLEQQIRSLEEQHDEWQITKDQLSGILGIPAVLDRVNQELEKLEDTRLQAEKQLNAVFMIQDSVSQQYQQILDILLRIGQARELERGKTFDRDSRPIWRDRESFEIDQGGRTFRRSFNLSFASAEQFVGTHLWAIVIAALLYIAFVIFIVRVRAYLNCNLPSNATHVGLQILKAPLSVVLLVTLIGTGGYIASAPIGIVFIFYLLYLIPVIRLLVPLTQAKLRNFIYALSVFYALEGLFILTQLPFSVSRIVSAILAVTASITFGYLLRSAPHVRLPVARSLILKVFIIGIRIDVLLLAVSLLGNFAGFVSMARLINIVALIFPFMAASLYCATRVLTLLVILVLQSHGARSLFQERTEAVQLWISRIFACIAAALCLKAILQLLTVYDSVLSGVSNLLTRPLGFLNVHFTLGGTLGVLVIAIGGYALANGIALVLKTVLLPRFPLQRGVSYSISRIAYYIMLIAFAIAGVSAAGLDLNRFTVLTGAIGVGLGFGLQNIINNFVSGIVLLFERPIHVGDTIDIEGLVGTVRRIGARSSTLLTFQGAEVIVPNNNLLSNQLINWTLSSQWRRVDVRVGVAYGTDPQRVIDLLVNVADSHAEILRERPPAAFFIGFGDSAMNFELRFWCTQQDTWFRIQSEVTIAVARALRDAGIEIPFPQRDLHVRSVEVKSAALNRDSTAANAPDVRDERPARKASTVPE